MHLTSAWHKISASSVRPGWTRAEAQRDSGDSAQCKYLRAPVRPCTRTQSCLAQGRACQTGTLARSETGKAVGRRGVVLGKGGYLGSGWALWLQGSESDRERGRVAKRVSWFRRLPAQRERVPLACALCGPRALGTREPLRPPGPWGPRPAAGRVACGLSSLCERPLPRGGGGGSGGLCVGPPAEGPRRGSDRASAV